MKIYLVDDDSEEADLFSDALQRIDSSIELVWFSSVMEALNVLLKDDKKPNILFLDLNIPQVSGKEMLRLLRVNNVSEQIPVVIYSTSISKRDIEETSAYNVKAYLQKPEDFQTLCSKLGSLLQC
jgi:DNA-binding response OmpR family regulator